MDRVIDVRELPHGKCAPTILETFDTLPVGESLVAVVDHDPKPLYYMFEAEHRGQFVWQYIQQGPELWRVKIGRIAAAG